MHGLVVLETNMRSKSAEEKASVHIYVTSKRRGGHDYFHMCLHLVQDNINQGNKSYLIEMKNDSAALSRESFQLLLIYFIFFLCSLHKTATTKSKQHHICIK